MKIKRLEVIGFKSFCDRAVLQFNEPITGVVGPNGCGKSNIVDAIRWCMGEQSAKHLRGKAMEDVIFAGSESRGPVGMCEVTLVFENDGRVPIEYLAYSEIAVTRKLYRDGTSEYFLNKTPCRLRDVTELFMGTGVGAKAYSIIEQGRVGMIVSSKAEDRRFLIEEAAGITKYKIKKKAAEKKMADTRQNLLRVSDVVAEIEKQLGSLRRQAQKAERYREYKAELRILELRFASQRWLGCLCEERVGGEALTAAHAERDAAEAQLSAREAEIEAIRLKAAEQEERLSRMQEGLYELDNRIRLAEAQNEHEGRQVTSAVSRAEQEASQIDMVERQAAEDATELERARVELAQLDASTLGQREELAAREERLRECKAAQQAVEGRTSGIRGEVAGCKADIARAEQEERAAARRRDELALRAERIVEEESRHRHRSEELRVEIGILRDRLEHLRKAKLDLLQEKKNSEARMVELKSQIAHDTTEFEKWSKELMERRSRRASLQEIQARYEGFERGTRAIMQDKTDRWGIRGLFADVVSAPPELESALEAALGHRLGAVLVESQEVGLDAIDHLRTKSAGRASFIPMNRFPVVEPSSKPEEAPRAAPEGTRGRLVDLIQVDAEYRPMVEKLLGEVLVVDELLAALDLWRSIPSALRKTYVTLGGELVDANGVVVGGSDVEGAGVLQQKREIRQLEEQLTTLEARHGELQLQLNANRGELQVLQKTLESLQKSTHEGEIQTLSLEKDLQRSVEEQTRIDQRLQVTGAERTELEEKNREAARETEEAQLTLRGARDRLVSLEDQISALGRESVAALDGTERAQEAVTRFRVEVAQTEEKRAGLRRTADRLEADGAEKRARAIRLRESVAEAMRTIQELRATMSARKEELISLVEERGRAAEVLQVGRNQYEEERNHLLEALAQQKGLRGALDRVNGEVVRLEMKLHELTTARQHLEQTIAERYRVELSAQVSDHHLAPLCGKVEEARTKELRDLIEHMGEINLHAVEEYKELEKRYLFLTGQKGDLEQALAQLEEAIDRINKTSRKRFREVFDLVNQKFQEIFPRCFRGGQARLVLTDEENLLESGIEIIAQPPGKKNATVELLSGGEKAMTAVALIFAIFLIKPSPFCLLDEVDAPLDEANVGRFNELIRELTDRSQFIVITHNKRTMQIADTLYGVTMEEPGISKLVSVNLSMIGKDSPGEKRSRAAA
jgi:chromosome segregation protein